MWLEGKIHVGCVIGQIASLDVERIVCGILSASVGWTMLVTRLWEKTDKIYFSCRRFSEDPASLAPFDFL